MAIKLKVPHLYFLSRKLYPLFIAGNNLLYLFDDVRVTAASVKGARPCGFVTNGAGFVFHGHKMLSQHCSYCGCKKIVGERGVAVGLPCLAVDVHALCMSSVVVSMSYLAIHVKY